MKVFLSHSHSDRILADGMRDLLANVFGDKIDVEYSSDRSAGGGIAPGEDWLPWIVQQVKESAWTLVLLTPDSLNKPWLLWEAGAVSGVGYAAKGAGRVVPVLYRISPELIPGPMRSKQGVIGEAREGVERLLDALDGSLDAGQRVLGSSPAARKALLNAMVPQHLDGVREALRERPLQLSESMIQEWLARLNALAQQGRWPEAAHVHRALRLAHAPLGAVQDVPLDVRIHRTLGEMYLAAKRAADAVAQFQLGLQLAARDLYLMHKLALAQVEAGDIGAAFETLAAIERLDAKITAEDPEFAGLRGRLHKSRAKLSGSRADLAAARDSYAVVMRAQPSSYYMADNVGQLSLQLGEVEPAREAFRISKAAIEKSGECSVWSLASLASACLVLGEKERALEALARLKKVPPTPRELDSVRGGFETLRASLGLGEADFRPFADALRG